MPLLEPLIPAPQTIHGGRPRVTDMRDVMNTPQYLNRSGCQWDMRPHGLLPKSTDYDCFARWRDDGTWQDWMDLLRTRVRVEVAKPIPPKSDHFTRPGRR